MQIARTTVTPPPSPHPSPPVGRGSPGEQPKPFDFRSPTKNENLEYFHASGYPSRAWGFSMKLMPRSWFRRRGSRLRWEGFPLDPVSPAERAPTPAVLPEFEKWKGPIRTGWPRNCNPMGSPLSALPLSGWRIIPPPILTKRLPMPSATTPILGSINRSGSRDRSGKHPRRTSGILRELSFWSARTGPRFGHRDASRYWKAATRRRTPND